MNHAAANQYQPSDALRAPERIESRFDDSQSTFNSSRVSSLSDGSDSIGTSILRKQARYSRQSPVPVRETRTKKSTEKVSPNSAPSVATRTKDITSSNQQRWVRNGKNAESVDLSRKAALRVVGENEDSMGSNGLGIVIQEFLCPLSGELPIDPYTAMDGVVYERESILNWIRGKPRDKLVSPTTGAPMGTRIFPAAQIRKAIERAVKSDAIAGPEVEQWTKKIELEREVEGTRNRAAMGDTDAMYHLGVWHQCGKKGMRRNNSKAFDWYKKSADAGHVQSMAAAGFLLVKGEGSPCNKVEGVALVTLAATEKGGVDTAAFCLANWYYQGLFGLPKSETWAIFWLKRVVSGTCNIRDMDDRGVARARALLNKLQK